MREVNEINLRRPTQQELRYFWQHFGFQYVHSSTGPSWKYPDNHLHYHLPVLNLASLEKWILPKVFSWNVGKNWKLTSDWNIKENGFKAHVSMVTRLNEAVDFYSISDKPVFALFWAIWEGLNSTRSSLSHGS